MDIITNKTCTNSFQVLKRSYRVSKLGIITQTCHESVDFTKITVIAIGMMQQLHNHDSLQAIQKAISTI